MAMFPFNACLSTSLPDACGRHFPAHTNAFARTRKSARHVSRLGGTCHSRFPTKRGADALRIQPQIPVAPSPTTPSGARPERPLLLTFSSESTCQLRSLAMAADCEPTVNWVGARSIRPAIGGEVRIPVSDPDCIRFEQFERRLLCQQHVAKNERLAWLETQDTDALAMCVKLFDVLMHTVPNAIAFSARPADHIEMAMGPILLALLDRQVLHEQLGAALVR